MINVMLLDDEAHANDILQDILMETGDVVVMGTYTHPQPFLEALGDAERIGQLPDAVFIDIEMPDKNGLEVAEMVKSLYASVEVVFVTAYSEYAIQAFELHSIDYLLKPSNRKRLEKTLARLHVAIASKRNEKAEDSDSLYVQSLGDLSLYYCNGKERLKWRTGKVKELFSYLLHHYATPVPAYILMDKLFSEVDDEKAKVNFYTSMSYLRKSLKEIGCPDAIQKNENGYVLHIQGMHWDYLEVEQLLKKADPNKGDYWGVIEQVMMLYKGDYFGEMEHRDFVLRRQQLRQHVFQEIQTAWEISKLLENDNRMLQCLHKMSEIAPESERIAFALIQFYVDVGHRAEAILYYHSFKQHLLDELGIVPSREFTDRTETLLTDSTTSFK